MVMDWPKPVARITLVYTNIYIYIYKVVFDNYLYVNIVNLFHFYLKSRKKPKILCLDLYGVLKASAALLAVNLQLRVKMFRLKLSRIKIWMSLNYTWLISFLLQLLTNQLWIIYEY